MRNQYSQKHICQNMFWNFLSFLIVCVISITPGFAVEAASTYQVSTFSADVTPPLGHALLGGLRMEAKEIRDPLYARGFVLFGAEKPILLVSIDWCEIRNEAYDHWRSELAKSVGTTRERVLLSSVHQHDAPLADLEAQKLLDAVGLNEKQIDVQFHQQSVQNVVRAIQKAIEVRKPVTHIGLGKAVVKGVASNRRVVHADGHASFSRGSITLDETIRNLPGGLIDPWIRTLSLWNEGQCLLATHFYAVHPMSYYGEGGVTSDFVGLARERLQNEDESIFQIYVSGCSGDVTGGKYNVGGEVGRRYLTNQMYQGMKKSFASTQKVKLEQIKFRSVPLALPPRDKGNFTVEAMQTILNDSNANIKDRSLAALGLSWRKRVARQQPIDIPVIDFSMAQLVLMPGESFVGYQLAAQKMRPDVFMFVAGYGECAMGYIPTADAVRDGFDNGWYWVPQDVKIESIMLKALKQAVQAKK